MKTAVVILNWNGSKMMRRFLPSVVANTTEDSEVWVADNASTDDSMEMLAREFPTVRTLIMEQNWGFAEGYNKALAQIDAEYYVLLNSDVEVTSGWLNPLVTYLDNNPDVAAVQPKLLKAQYDIPSDSQLADCQFEYAGAAGGFIDKHGYPYCRGRLFGIVEDDHGQYDTAMEVHWATGACLVVRAKDYHEMGGLDGRFFAHNEEIDLCWRMRIAGKKIMCLPESKVYHLGGGTLPQGNPRKTYLNFRNNLTMLYKNLPEAHLRSVMHWRLVLDYVAMAQALAKGNLGDVKAIAKARRDFNKWKNNFKNDRMEIQSNRTLNPDKDLARMSLLWQFFIRGKKTWDKLPSMILLVLMLTTSVSMTADDKTRGIGVYPGRPNESYATTVEKTKVFHNLTLNHAAYHSSSYDFNLTAQLVTDGLAAKAAPAWMEVLLNGKPTSLRERDWAFNGNEWSGNTLMGGNATYEIKWHNMKVRVDSIYIDYMVAYHRDQATKGYNICFTNGKNPMLQLQSDNGLPGPPMRWEVNADPNKQDRGAETLPACRIKKGYALECNDSINFFKAMMNMEGAEYWRLSDIKFYYQGKAVDTELISSSRFQSAWRSAEGGNQWVYVDMGAEAQVEKVRLYWLGFAPKGRLEISDDAQSWVPFASLPTDQGVYYEIAANKVKGRYIRVSMEGSDIPYTMVELEALGRGGTVALPHAEAPVEGNKWMLNGGDWRVQRESEVKWSGEVVSIDGYPVKDWIPATVPGTVLTSYVNAGAVADQNYDDNMYYTSESFFNSNFWYRREFKTPTDWQGKRIYLNLDGINWKAQIWLNGRKVGRVEGAFTRGRFDITSLLRKNDTNVLAIEIEKVAHPGSVKEKNSYSTDINGGLLGYDNPTFHATVGWDWITSVRGRDIGIWNDVFLTAESGMNLSDPLVTTTLNLPDTLATLRPQVRYRNETGRVLNGTIIGWVGDLKYEKAVKVNPGMGAFTFNPSEFDQLRDQKMRLWWPNGYGEPYLYDAGFCFLSESGDTLSTVNFKQGVRQVTYKDKQTKLTIYVNGRRVVPLGGNWGFSEHNLNYRGREYDTAVKYHRDMNFNMIRNWVGQTGDDEFYDACDKYGVMVWQDFWLANPADGPDPADEEMFMHNATDYVSRIRHHASIAIYCGRNEGYPPETLNKSLEILVKGSHPGMEYIASSADDGVSGHGPYWAIPAKDYFERQTGLLHSERGMPNVMTYEGLSRTLRPENMWPQNIHWGQHDYTMAGAQRGATFNKLIEQYGDIQSAEEFTKLAQFVNYDGYRAMYESGSAHRMGLLIWMSHACWPSMTWQCYDYYYEPTAAYFGCKKGCEPLHIQYNASTSEIEVVNLGVGDSKKMKYEVGLYDINGRKLSGMKGKVNSLNDSNIKCGVVDTHGAAVLRMKLTKDKTVISENTYILDPAELQKAKAIDVKTTVKIDGCKAVVTLEAPKDAPVYMIRLNLKDDAGEQILPVMYEDNYFHLLPGEKKTVNITWLEEDQHTPGATVEITTYN